MGKFERMIKSAGKIQEELGNSPEGFIHRNAVIKIFNELKLEFPGCRPDSELGRYYKKWFG